MTKINKNNIKTMYLLVIDYIHPFTIDNKEAPRENRPSKLIHKLQFILRKCAKISREIRDPNQVMMINELISLVFIHNVRV